MTKLTEEFKELGELQALLADWARFRAETSEEGEALACWRRAVEAVKDELDHLKNMPPRPDILKEPESYEEILSCCPKTEAHKGLPKDFEKRLTGAFIGRLAGCVLGVPVEGWSPEAMRKLAAETGTPFPPTEYWHDVSDRYALQYEESPRWTFAKDKIDHVPADDDIMFTLLNLILMERYGVDFTTKQVAELWLKEITIVCTAEKEALENLKRGIAPESSAEGNPYVEWIGAAIRADAFGYVCPGKPELAARMAFQDGYLTHRRNGLYGEMFFAALIAASFEESEPERAIGRALLQIPPQSALAQDIRWTMDQSGQIKDPAQARKAMEERFGTMSWVHVRNNTTLILFAVLMAAGDFSKAIASAVAMGMDNDCTAATVGSIMGALYGIDRIPQDWYRCFRNRIKTFLRTEKDFRIDDIIRRFYRLAEEIDRESVYGAES